MGVRQPLLTTMKEQIRGMIGALIVLGVTFMYTMESWWHGWQLPFLHLMVYDIIGLAVVLFITEYVGFREGNSGRKARTPVRVAVDFSELVLQSFIVAFVAFTVIRVYQFGDPVSTLVRLGLITVVPLAFGAALSNQLLTGKEKEERERSPLLQTLAVYALGAVFIAATIAPTQEVGLIAAYAGWMRIGVLLVFTLIVVHLVLNVPGFKGQERRTTGRSQLFLLGGAFVVYAEGVLITFLLLLAFGHLRGQPFPVWIGKTIVLAFPAAIGASVGRVVIG